MMGEQEFETVLCNNKGGDQQFCIIVFYIHIILLKPVNLTLHNSTISLIDGG